MNDIKPMRPVPKRPLNPVQASQASPSQPESTQPLPVVDTPSPAPKPPKSKKKLVFIILGAVLGLILATVAAAFIWYQNAISPLAPNNTDKMQVEVVEGSSPSQIGQLLEEKKLIKSAFAFDIFTRLTNTKGKLQAGNYHLSPSESVSQIVDHMISGRIDEFSITFFPGATLRDTSGTPENKKTDVTTMLLKAGYEEDEIKAALGKQYDHPLFATKPANADLEGYVYGETYSFSSDATVEEVLTRTFDEFYEVIEQNNLVQAFEEQGLTLYEGITLASIIQREVPESTDQKQVAQVFFKRLAMGMELGSDVTYQYAARELGVAPTPSLDSPYNTRIVKGLPPGPIAAPGVSALEAVAHPADGDYVYFLSGDDDVTYFARTNEEHEANIRDHCQYKCSFN
ncbi:MAG TPA: endolytic transglycosylase MltG [Candidatus Saccharimonadales bacterium]